MSEAAIGIMFIAWVIMSSIAFYNYDKTIKKKLAEVKQQLYDLELCKTRIMYEEYHESPEIQITQLQQRAKRLEFCYQCPLYQDKVQANKTKER